MADEREQLRRTLLRFSSEIDRITAGSWVDMPTPLVRLVDALESEPLISAHLDACLLTLAPESFDAADEVDRVLAEHEAAFGPFEPDSPASTAQTYLIVSELARRGLKFEDPLFAEYGLPKPRLQDRFACFVDDVVTPLIDSVNAHLEQMAEALGPDPCEPTQSSGTSAASAEGTVSHEVTREQMEALLNQVRAATATLVPADREDALAQLDALSDELLCPEPKERVARVLVRVLGAIASKGAFAEALARLDDALEHYFAQ